MVTTNERQTVTATQDESPWRGVWAVEPKREVLFAQRIELDLRMLPRAKPQIILTRRMLEDDEDE